MLKCLDSNNHSTGYGSWTWHMGPLTRIEQDLHGMDSVPQCRSMLKTPLILYCDSRSSNLQRGGI